MSSSATDMSRQQTKEQIKTWDLSDKAGDERLWSSDAVIDAYFKGKKDGLDEQQRVLKSVFADNFKKSDEMTGALFNFLMSQNVKPISAHLRIDSISSFEVVVVLTEADYLGEKMLAIYKWSLDLQEQYTSDSFRLCFSFIDAMDGFDFNQLKSDGFNFEAKLEYRSKKK